MIKIDHIALWVKDLDRMKTFYQTHFGACAGEKYENPKKQFQSYFLQFAGGSRLELMHRPDIAERAGFEAFGYAHIALSVGSKEAVDEMAQTLQDAGLEKLSGPRTTGDGCYEAAFKDPENNTLEITV